MTKWVSYNLLLTICFSIGIFSACGDQVETNENYPNPTISYEELSFKIEDLEIYEIQTQEDFDHVLVKSYELNKPVLLQITALASVNSRKFEDRVWTSLPVYPVLKNQFIVAQIFVDSRMPLPNAIDLRDSMNTVGKYWLNYEEVQYSLRTQPILDIINHENESFVQELATYQNHFDEFVFKEWLEEGLTNFY
jgi:hypothetical protein